MYKYRHIFSTYLNTNILGKLQSQITALIKSRHLFVKQNKMIPLYTLQIKKKKVRLTFIFILKKT